MLPCPRLTAATPVSPLASTAAISGLSGGAFFDSSLAPSGRARRTCSASREVWLMLSSTAIELSNDSPQATGSKPQHPGCYEARMGKRWRTPWGGVGRPPSKPCSPARGGTSRTPRPHFLVRTTARGTGGLAHPASHRRVQSVSTCTRRIVGGISRCQSLTLTILCLNARKTDVAEK